MYSYVVLAPGRKRDHQDGLLEAWEIMGLDLVADLVVLSACETARGRVATGEGMLGFTWSLFLANCPTSVSSQWKVPSDSTTLLMIEFHKRFAQAVPIAQALQQAAIEVRKVEEFKHPYHWASFIATGVAF